MGSSSAFHPNWASPPGDTIADILKERQLSITFFAEEINQSRNYVDGLIKGYEVITEELAKKLEAILGGTSNFWLTRELQYREDLEHVTRLEQEMWLKELPIKDMISFGWISNTKELISECLSFFNVPNVVAWRQALSNSLSATSFRKTATFKSDYGAVATWLRVGELLGAQIDCKPWNASLFEETLEEIKFLTRKKSPKDFLPVLIESCAKCGVAVTIVRTPNGCRASGATKFISDNRALMLLSFRYLSDDQFWFTFFHEAGHLLLHGSNKAIIEGLVEEGDDFEKEKEANLFAGELLIPHSMHEKLSRIRGNKREIINFAIMAGVSPGIVVGQMQHHGFIDRKYLNSYKRRYSWEEIL